MRLDRYVKNHPGEFNTDTMTGLFSVAGDFGIIDGNTICDCNTTDNGVIYTYKTDKVALCAEFVFLDNGGVLRKDSLTNISKDNITAYRLTSRFCLEGGEYDVFTQSNGWQHECVGRWQPLSTQITTASTGVRTCESACPVMALDNKQNGRVSVFHLFPNCQWKMSVARKTMPGIRDMITVETGLEDSGLHFDIASGEKILFPEILFYECKDKVGLGSHILHEYFNNAYPRKKLPAIYNTWLYAFTDITYESLIKQADIACELGFEYFVIDAGWFGEVGKPWSDTVGDWEEDPSSGFKGKMKEFADYIRSKGMKFGLWIEPERASKNSNNRIKNPEHYVSVEYLSDYSKPEVVDKLFGIVCRLVDTYGIKYFKFDFNRSVGYDEHNTAFYRYMQGQKEFVRRIREKYPDIYLSNCASGGIRIDLEQAKFFDSFWISDNQGPIEGLRIYTQMLKRLPASIIERWNVQKSVKELPVKDGEEDTIVSCNDANWRSLAHVDESFTFAFLQGGPLGYSCDINFPEWYKKHNKEFISNYLADFDFWRNASASILCDTDNQTVIEYADKNHDNVIIHYFTKLVWQEEFTVFPVLDENADYLLNGEKFSGKELALNGYVFDKLTDYTAKTLSLKKIK